MSASCYDCKHKGPVAPGSGHHISCAHPRLKLLPGLDAILMMSVLAHDGEMCANARGLCAATGSPVIRGRSHGVKNGWFNWPLEYDPVWLEECDGFEKKEDQTDG